MEILRNPEMTFGERVRIARRRRKLSQSALAALVDRHAQTVQAWETDRVVPVRYSDVVKIADALAVDVDWLDPGARVRNRCFTPAPGDPVPA